MSSTFAYKESAIKAGIPVNENVPAKPGTIAFVSLNGAGRNNQVANREKALEQAIRIIENDGFIVQDAPHIATSTFNKEGEGWLFGELANLKYRYSVMENNDDAIAWGKDIDILYDKFPKNSPFKLSESSTNKTPQTQSELQSKYPQSIVVQSESELPLAIRNKIREGNYEGKVKGVEHNGVVYMIADNIESAQDGDKVFRHEYYGHAALKRAVGEGLRSLALSVFNKPNKARTSRLNELSQLYFGKDVSELNESEKQEIGEEYIANIAEYKSKDKTLWESIKDMVKSVFKSLGYDVDTITDREIELLIQGGESDVNEAVYAKTGGKNDNNRFELSETKESRFYTKPDNSQIISAILSDYDVSFDSLPIETQKEILEKMDNNPSIIEDNNFIKALTCL